MECIGLDVHKRYCQVAILDDESTTYDPEEHRVSTDRDELEGFAAEHADATAAIEATRNYWFVYDCLSDHLEVQVANPHKTRLISEQKVKSDRLDAKRLAVLVRAGLIPESYVPPEDYREARKLVRRRKTLVEQRTAAKNRVRSVMADRGIVNESDVFSEDGRTFFADDDLPLSETDRQLIETDLTVIDSLDEQVARLQGVIDEIAATWQETQLAMTIPGIGPCLSATIIAELGELDRFDNKKQVVSYAGLDPRVRQSGEKEATGPITKDSSSVLRWALGQAALNVVKYDSYLGSYYARMKDRKHKKVALVATARKLLVAIYAMLTKEEVYKPQPAG